MSKKMKILYLMHINWGWIKQRPQFLAEKLGDNNYVRVYCNPVFEKKHNFEKPKNIKCKNYFRIPFSRTNKIISDLTAFINKALFSIIILIHRPDYIWLCGPLMYEYIPKKYSSLVVYDCMDDYLSFENILDDEHLFKVEKDLCNNANIIFASAESLQEKLSGRYHISKEKIHIIRNAYDGKLLNVMENKSKNDDFHIAYVGTISTWIDFELINVATIRNKNLVFDMYGPIACSVDKWVNNSQIVFHGSIPHEKIFSYVEDADALIMPFVLNDLIRSVDPVKLYEYINFNKNIICVKYDEILRFSEFVFFYENEKDFLEIINNLMQNNRLKYSQSQREVFLNNNNWNQRVNEIERILIENKK